MDGSSSRSPGEVPSGSNRWSRRCHRRSERSLVCNRDEFQLSRSEEHTSELQSQSNLVCRLLLEKKKKSFLVISQKSTRWRSYYCDKDIEIFSNAQQTPKQYAIDTTQFEHSIHKPSHQQVIFALT